MIADRVGWLIAKNACCTESSAITSHTFWFPAAAWSQNSRAVTMRPTVVNMRSLRRSSASASAPPQSPKTMRGTSANTPVSPT